jgi:hypothetical protein
MTRGVFEEKVQRFDPLGVEDGIDWLIEWHRMLTPNASLVELMEAAIEGLRLDKG